MATFRLTNLRHVASPEFIPGGPVLTGLDASVTFAENTVNAAPQLLDADVDFTDSNGDYDGGNLSVSGLLAEDTLSIRNEGSGAGQIGLIGSDVTYGGVVIGTLAGGAGSTLNITFNASATAEAIDALIQNLTYANTSGNPTATRVLTINVTGADGHDLDWSVAFAQRSGDGNPLSGTSTAYSSAPTFADLDGDGDLDLVLGEIHGGVRYFQNTGSSLEPTYTERVGTDNPFSSIDVGTRSNPTLADLDGDGDLDLVVGESDGNLNYFENTGTDETPVFTPRVGGSTPVDGIDIGTRSSPAFADLDGDGDLDLVVGAQSGALLYFENSGTDQLPDFTSRTGAANPFNGIDVGAVSTPSFVDLDRDGDLDLVIGEDDGSLRYFENTGTNETPAFTARTGVLNPFEDIDVGQQSTPSFTDLDGDGDLDLMVGDFNGDLRYFENITVRGVPITVNVSAEDDGSVIIGTEDGEALTGSSGADTVLGLGGDDILDGEEGDDVLEAGAGNDRLIGGAGSDVFDGGGGQDVVVYADAGAGVSVDLSLEQASDDGDGGTDILLNIEDVVGSSFDDTIVGSDGANSLVGGFGNDTLDGRGGVDRVSYADRTSSIVANLSRGTVTSVNLEGIEEDALFNIENLRGGSADDRLTGDERTNVLEGGMGNDIMAGEAGDDVLLGQSGDDTLRGGSGNDTLNGGSGTDTAVFSGARADYTITTIGDVTTVTGADGTDTITNIERLRFSDGVFDVANVISGTAGSDFLAGDSNNNNLLGLDGNDILRGGAGNDGLNGGDGIDTADYSDAAGGVNIDLVIDGAQQTNGSGRDTLSSVENLVGSAFRDGFKGDAGDNVMFDSLGGRDTFDGRAGNDTLTVERSGDIAATSVTLKGGTGADALSFDGHGRYVDTVYLSGEADDDLITATGARRASINAGDGNDTVVVDTMGGAFKIVLGAGSDTIRLADTGGLFRASASTGEFEGGRGGGSRIDNKVKDFQVGLGGDVLDLTAYLSGGALINYVSGENPFATGHMRLSQFDRHTLLQIDRDGSGNGSSYQSLLAFDNTTAANFTAANFNGIDPTGVAPIPVLTADKDADAGPQVWVLADSDKAQSPEVLPGAEDEAGDGFPDVGPLIGVSGGGSDPWMPLTLEEAGDGFLTGPGHPSLDEAGPRVLPGQPADHWPEPGELFAFARAGRSDLFDRISGEDGEPFPGAPPRDFGHDGWVF